VFIQSLKYDTIDYTQLTLNFDKLATVHFVLFFFLANFNCFQFELKSKDINATKRILNYV